MFCSSLVNTAIPFIPLSDKKPVYYNHPDNTFVRYGSADVRASKEEIDAITATRLSAPKRLKLRPEARPMI